VHAGTLHSVHGCRVDTMHTAYCSTTLHYLRVYKHARGLAGNERARSRTGHGRTACQEDHGFAKCRLELPPDQTGIRPPRSPSPSSTSVAARNGIGRWSTCDPDEELENMPAKLSLVGLATIRGQLWFPTGSHKSNSLVEPPDLVEPTSIRRYHQRQPIRRSLRRPCTLVTRTQVITLIDHIMVIGTSSPRRDR
jgi:hypothetical protein